jgi:antirestriction protein ArdC
MDRAPPRDHRAEVTETVIRLMEEGAAPWQRPWTSEDGLQFPVNSTTGRACRGGNVLSLLIASMKHGYTDPRFCTFKQALEKDWHVRKSEHGHRIEFWEVKPGRAGPEDGDDEHRSRLIHRTHTVFDAQQIDGIPAIVTEPRKPFEIIEDRRKARLERKVPAGNQRCGRWHRALSRRRSSEPPPFGDRAPTTRRDAVIYRGHSSQ